MRKSIQNKGFTLLEILLVIGAIGILAAIVLVAINPNRQLEAARNAKRRSDINTIQKAIQQYSIDNNGQYPAGIETGAKAICRGGTPVGCIDLSILVPNYLASIPEADSNYYYVRRSNNNIEVSHPRDNIWNIGGTPSLDLNFASNKSLIDSVSGKNLIDFTRNSTGTYVGEDGLIKTAGINEPRFDHDPTTGESLGLLVEEERENYVRFSGRPDINWILDVSGGNGLSFVDGETVTSSSGGFSATYVSSLSTSTQIITRLSSGFPAGVLTGITSGATKNIISQLSPGGLSNLSSSLTNEVISPDGAQNAFLVTPNTTGTQLRLLQKTYLTSTAGTYTFSIFFKNKNIVNNTVAIRLSNQDATAHVRDNFNITTKTFSGSNINLGGWVGSVGYQDYPNGWMRIWVTATTTSNSHTSISGNFWLGGYQGTTETIGSMYVWESQLERGAFPTSQISTTTTSSTRIREVAIVDGSNFTGFYNPLEGSIYTHYNIKGSFGIDGFNRVFEISNGTSNNRFTLLSLGANDDVYEAWQINGVNEMNFNTINTNYNRFYKWVAGYKENDFQRYSIDLNGNLDSNIDNTISVSSFIPNQFNIGYEASSNIRQLNGHIDRLTYYNRRLSNEQLQSITQ